MPIYEYECEKCGAAFEMMQSISAKPVTNCVKVKCTGKARRQISASGFILKGAGWYSNDYPSEARKQGWKQENCQASGGSPDATCGKNECSQPATPPDEKPKAAGKGKPANCQKKKKVKA